MRREIIDLEKMKAMAESIPSDTPQDPAGAQVAMALPRTAPPKINPAISENNEEHLEEIKPATDLSAWVGKDEYYIERDKDYRKRYPWKRKSPYYLDFGDRYLKAFNVAKPQFSEKGQKWVNATSLLLKQYMEAGLKEDFSKKDPRQYKEYDGEKFMQFAYGTYAKAYTNAGICHLVSNRLLGDLKLIWDTIKGSDILDKKGINQMRDVLTECIIRTVIPADKPEQRKQMQMLIQYIKGGK